MVNYLFLSNDLVFGPTLEGEGRYVGYPSIFLRLAMCNLTCKGFASPDSPHGCDSFISWSHKNKLTFEEIFKIFDERGYIEYLRCGTILKITGGEPLIQQHALEAFIEAFIGKYHFVPKIDFETNATIEPSTYWLKIRATFTTSPKLSSNGDPEKDTYKPDVLKWHVKHGSCFKFVVKSQQDVDEIYRKYIHGEPQVLPESVWLMPCAGSRQEHLSVQGWVAEVCKQSNFKFSPRLHLLIWDKALLV